MTAWGETYKWTLRGIGSGLFALFLVTVAQGSRSRLPRYPDSRPPIIVPDHR
jgi:hypothetical protein